MRPTEWILRPIVWFATASILTTVLHEFTHACVAYAFGVRSTLRNYWVRLDLTPEQAATSIPLLIAVAGPTICLVLGIGACVAFKRARGTAAELPLLFFAVFGIGTFFGNLMSASFIGDFSAAAVALHLPMPVRYGVSLFGACMTAGVHFLAGRELARWIPSPVGKVTGVFGVVIVPTVVGMTIVILANLPSASAEVRSAEAAFWVFAAIGALVDGAPKGTPYASIDGARDGTPNVPHVGRRDPPYVGRPDSPNVGRPFRGADPLRLTDAAALLLAILIARLLVRGVPFVP